MKAIQVTRPEEISIIDKDTPEISGEREVLVKTKVAGICLSDIHIYHGTSPFATYPRVIGHEIVGEVVRTGKAVTRLKAGDRVVLEPIESCGYCYACKKDRPNICENLIVWGVNRDGGFQEYFIADESQLHRLPSDLDWEKAVMIEPFTVGMQACVRGSVEKNDLVLIYGAGPTGLSVLENAKLKGAVCIAADIDDGRLLLAKSFEADYVLNPDKVDMVDQIAKISGGMMCNVIVDAVGSPDIIQQAMDLVSVAGRIVSLGFKDVYAGLSLNALTKKEVSVHGSRLQTHLFEPCISIFGTRKLHLQKLVSHIFDFSNVYEAVSMIENHSDDVAKIILRFDPDVCCEKLNLFEPNVVRTCG